MPAHVVCLLALGLAALVSRLPQASFVTAPQRDRRPADGRPRSVDVSADGRFVAFASSAPLLPGDADGQPRIYVLDLTTRRVSLETASAGPGTAAVGPRLSGDGRFLVFESRPGSADGTPEASQIVLRDRRTDTSRVISAAVGGSPGNASSGNPDISDDGRVVVFASTATDLVREPDANGPLDDVFVFDAATTRLRRLHVDQAAAADAAVSTASPAVSGDGQWVAVVVSSGAAANRRGSRRVFACEIDGPASVHVSVAAKGAAPNGNSWAPAISRDGRLVAFVSEATNLAGSGHSRTANVFVRDLRDQVTALVSRSAGGHTAASGLSAEPVLSADGRFVVFRSDAANLVCARNCAGSSQDINLLPDIFVADRRRRVISRVSADASGGWMDPSREPAVDGSGRVIAFSSRHPTDALDTRDDFDLFVREDSEAPAAGLSPTSAGSCSVSPASSFCVGVRPTGTAHAIHHDPR